MIVYIYININLNVQILQLTTVSLMEKFHIILKYLIINVVVNLKPFCFESSTKLLNLNVFKFYQILPILKV